MGFDFNIINLALRPLSEVTQKAAFDLKSNRIEKLKKAITRRRRKTNSEKKLNKTLKLSSLGRNVVFCETLYSFT